MARNAEDALILTAFFTMLWGFLRRRKNVAAQAAASGGAAGGGVPLAGAGTGEPEGQFTGSVSLPPGFGFDFDQFNLPDGTNSFFGNTTSQPAAPAVDPVEKDWLARTIWGEARDQGDVGMRAVAAVVMNRVASRRHPNTVQGVVTKPLQFSMWNRNDPNGPKARAVTTATPGADGAAFRAALRIADDALTGRLSDPTGGATLYYSPAAMKPPGSVPSTWDFSKLRFTGQIGGSRFYVEL